MNEALRIKEPERLLLTVQDYRILADAGAFEHRSRVELIDGVILAVSPRRRWHLRVKSEIAGRLRDKVRELELSLLVEIDGTVALSDHNAPDPDVILAARGPLDDYVDVEAVSLLVEVADTSIRFDLGAKRLLYAGHRIPEYWVVSRTKLHRFWSPEAGDYQGQDERPFGQVIESVTIPGVMVETAGIV